MGTLLSPEGRAAIQRAADDAGQSFEEMVRAFQKFAVALQQQVERRHRLQDTPRYYTDHTGRVRRTKGMQPIIRKGLRA